MTLSLPAFLKPHEHAAPGANIAHSRGIEASYEDMHPGGVHKRAEMRLGNLSTLHLITDALETADQYRAAHEQDELRQPFLVHQLREMEETYSEYPVETSVTVIEEPARQARRFITDAALGRVEGLDDRTVQDLKFLNVIMLGLNEHPPIADGQPIGPSSEEVYTTNERPRL